jgi:transposase
MAYREVTMIEITEVLRQWLAGAGHRQIARRLGLDPKTVRRYLRAAERCGLAVGMDAAALSEGQVTAVVTALRPGAERPYGPGWQTCEAQRSFIEERLRAGVRLSKIRRLLQRQGVQLPRATLYRFATAVLGAGRGAPTIPVVDGAPGVNSHRQCATDSQAFSLKMRHQPPEDPLVFSLAAASARGLSRSIDYHVEFEDHYYSVPWQLRGERLDLRATATTVELFQHGRRVASHVRSYVKHKPTTEGAHMPAAHRAHLEWSPSRLIAWGATVGPATAALLEAIMQQRPHPEQGYRACLGLMRLQKRYPAARLERACARALHFRACSYKSVVAILHHRLDEEALPTTTTDPPRTLPHHGNIRGSRYYH